MENYENLLAKDLNDQCIGMNINQKVRIKTQRINVDIFTNQILQELTDYFFQFIQMLIITKRYKARRYYLPKGVNKNGNVIINGKNFYDQPIDSDKKPYKK